MSLLPGNPAFQLGNAASGARGFPGPYPALWVRSPGDSTSWDAVPGTQQEGQPQCIIGSVVQLENPAQEGECRHDAHTLQLPCGTSCPKQSLWLWGDLLGNLSCFEGNVEAFGKRKQMAMSWKAQFSVAKWFGWSVFDQTYTHHHCVPYLSFIGLGMQLRGFGALPCLSL